MNKKTHFILLEESGYFGGKSGEGVYHTIINQLPKHKTYVAGFLGLDAVMRIKKPAAFNIGIEINPDVVEIWKKAKFPQHKDLAPPKLTVLKESFFDVALPCLYDSETLLYLDPPYTHKERKSNNRYPFEITLEQHEELLDIALELGCMVAISCYDNDIYEKKLKGWRKIQFQAMTRSGKKATETLYMNYPEVAPEELHDNRFTGTDYRRREVTRKRLKTIHGKIERLEAHERALFFKELKENYPLVFGEKLAPLKMVV